MSLNHSLVEKSVHHGPGVHTGAMPSSEGLDLHSLGTEAVMGKDRGPRTRKAGIDVAILNSPPIVPLLGR